MLYSSAMLLFLFQFTSPYGDEPGYSLQAVPDVKFQFTSPYGNEQDDGAAERQTRTFQFTSPYGDEPEKPDITLYDKIISIHVSLRRRTAKRINMLDLYFLIEQPQQ